MTKKKREAQSSVSLPLEIGAKTELTANTPVGLFESDRGNKYLIVDYKGIKIVVGLVNPYVPPFTWVGLCDIAVEWGRWLGPYRVWLQHRIPADRELREAGAISLYGTATIHCRAFNSTDCYFPLGQVAAGGSRDGQYDGWIVEAVAGERLF